MSAITVEQPTAAPGRSSRWADLVSLAVLSFSSGALHVSAAQGHWGESHLYGTLFILLTVFQVAWGVAILMSDRTVALLRIGTIVNVATIIIYICSRTWGLPVGPDLGHPESLGIPDFFATVDEAVPVLLTWMMLRYRRPLPERAHLGTVVLAFCSLIVFTAIAHIT